MWRSMVATVIAVGFLALSACGGDDNNNSDNNNTGNNGDSDTQSALSDAQILGITHAINQGEIDQANAASGKLQDNDAQAFATKMLTEHSATLAQQTALEQSQNITRAESNVSAQLESQSTQVVAQLQQGTAGAAYDRMYIQAQVDGHQNALDLITNQLLPDAGNGAVHDYLSDLRGHVQDHLSDAQSILNDLPAS
jgi:putative membrane protein